MTLNRERPAWSGAGVVVRDSERALVPVGSEPAGPPPVPDGWVEVPRLLVAAALGLAVEAQRRSLDAVGAVVGHLGWPLRVLARPAVALALGSVAVARHHLDLDGWAARVDLDRVVDRVDPNQIAARIDLDAIVGRVDLDAIVARIDLPRLTEQIIDEVDLGELIRESSSTMASETVDALRVQGMRVDGLVSRLVDRVLLRQGQRQTGPLPEQLRP
jgi:hypothetical protein